MKLNYDAMSKQELRAHILKNRDDLAAMQAFFDRRSPDAEAIWYAPPQNWEEWQHQSEQIRPILDDRG